MAQNAVQYLNTSPSGAELLDDKLTGSQENFLTTNSGVSRPSYVKNGTLWIDTSATPNILKLFNGTDDTIIGYIDNDNQIFKPSATFVLTDNNTFTGTNTFNSSVTCKSTLTCLTPTSNLHAATKLYVDNSVISVDDALSSSSENPVQNKVVNTALALKANSTDMTTALALKTDTSFSNVNSTAKANSMNWGMPDYNSIITITLTTSSSYTVPSAGYFMGRATTGNYSYSYVKINNQDIITSGADFANYHEHDSYQYSVAKGDVISTTGTQYYVYYFAPCKGV